MQNLLSFRVPLPSDDPTVGEVIRLYLSLEAKIETRRSRRAWKEREQVLRQFDTAYGTLLVSKCTKAHLKVWIEGNPRWKSDWTRSRICRTVQRPFNWAADEMDLPLRNPFKGVRYRKGRRGRPLTEEEFAGLLKLAGTAFGRVLQFCRLTGARPAEMAAARWGDVSTDGGQAWITLFEHKTSDREGARPRVIGLPAAAMELLATIRRSAEGLFGLEPHEAIFLNRRGRPWTRNALGLSFRKLRARAKLPADAKLYGLRHAFATGAIEAGVALKDLAELLGHTTTAMSEHYVHLAGKHGRLCTLADKAVAGLAELGELGDVSGPASPPAGSDASRGDRAEG